MADLGNILAIAVPSLTGQTLDVWAATHTGISGVEPVPSVALRPAPHPVFAATALESISMDVSGEVRGTVLSGSTPVSGVRVDLYHRNTAMCIGTTTTNAFGEFVFQTLPTITESLFAIAFDPDGGDTYNALIFDKLTPV